MKDFEFIKNPISGKWVISAPRRSARTNVGSKVEPICPFCPGPREKEKSLYQIGAGNDWKIRVVPNKFPFASHHEIIIHSPDHHKNFDELPFPAVKLILQTYRKRYNFHHQNGSVYIFNNSGSAAGASLTHPHTQLVVMPSNIELDVTPMDMRVYSSENSASQNTQKTQSSSNSEDQIIRRSDNSDLPSVPSILDTDHFLIFCPPTSEWPDEIWIAPKLNGGGFGEITDKGIIDIAFVLSRLIQIMDLRHGNEFPFNFYINPGKNWYLRLIPRTKIIGGFELGTNIIVNTQDPEATFAFIKEHFWEPDHEKIKREHQAEYLKRV